MLEFLKKCDAEDITPITEYHNGEGYIGDKHDYIVETLTPTQGGGYVVSVFTHGGSEDDGSYNLKTTEEVERFIKGLEA